MKTQIDPIVEKFRPPTYYEVKTGKPYRTRIGKTKWIYEVNPLSAAAAIRIIELHSGIMKLLEDATNRKISEGSGFTSSSVQLIQGYVSLASLLWEISNKPKSFISRVRMRSAFMKQSLENIEWLYKINKQILDSTFRISFFFETPGELLSDSKGTVAGDGFYSITRGYGDPNKTPWVEYLFIREAEKLEVINQWKANKNAEERDKRNRRK